MDDSKRRELLGASIRSARGEQGISQADLGRMLGHSSGNYIYEIEVGKKNPSILELAHIAEALGMKARDLIEF